MATCFNLVPCKGFVWKQSFINCTTRCATYGTLSVHSRGALKNYLLRQGEMFHATCFILLLLLRKFFKTVGEILHLLTLYPKLNFRGALKKAFTIPKDRSYQTQYFVKIFPSPLASMLHVDFYLHLKESSENAAWIAIALKSATFSGPETALETTYFMLFLKNLTKNLEKKLMIVFLLIE